jgi:hypothetical protein
MDTPLLLLSMVRCISGFCSRFLTLPRLWCEEIMDSYGILHLVPIYRCRTINQGDPVKNAPLLPAGTTRISGRSLQYSNFPRSPNQAYRTIPCPGIPESATKKGGPGKAGGRGPRYTETVWSEAHWHFRVLCQGRPDREKRCLCGCRTCRRVFNPVNLCRPC